MANAPANAAPVSLTLSPNTPNDPCTPIVGLIDTGVQSLGSQLDQFMLPAINVTGDTVDLSSTVPTHGTAMAQTIATGVQQQGGSSSVRILPVNVLWQQSKRQQVRMSRSGCRRRWTAAPRC